MAVALVTLGLLLTVVGVVLVPLPGPGWPVLMLGAALTAVGAMTWFVRRQAERANRHDRPEPGR